MKKFLSLLWVLLWTVMPTLQAQTVPPLGTTIETWYLTYTMHYYDENEHTESGSEPMKIAIDGSDVYFNMANPLTGNSWVKGTLSGTTATFANGQQMGTHAGEPFYLSGLNESSLCDVVFYYNSEKGIFTLGDMYLLINGSATVNNPWCYFSVYTLTKDEVKEPEVVTPPAGIITSEYSFTYSAITYDGEGFVTTNEQRNVRIGTMGNEVYMQGICKYLPTAWVKGKRNSDGDLTFASGQYYGTYVPYKYFFAAAEYPTSSPEWASDITLYYDKTSKSYSTNRIILLNTKEKELSPIEMYANAKFTKINNVAATPAAPEISQYVPYEERQDGTYGLVMLNIPTLSATGEPLLTSKLSYQLYFSEGAPYVFQPSRYPNLTEEMTLIPYNFGDGRDIFMAGSAVFFYDDVKDAEKVGVQSVYTGGNETHESEITWFDINAYRAAGIDATKSSKAQPVSESFTDLQGRPIGAATKGLLLKTVRLSDGTLKTVKVVRK